MRRVGPWTYIGVVPLALAVLVAGACLDPPTAPPPVPSLRFEPPVVQVAAGHIAVVRLRNPARTRVGPVRLHDVGVRDGDGRIVSGATLGIDPAEVASLEPLGETLVTLTMDPAGLPIGQYAATVEARVAGQLAGQLEVTLEVHAPGAPVASLSITGGPVEPRRGDVVTYSAEARDAQGGVLAGARIAWAVLPRSAGIIDASGEFVGYEPGPARIVASAGSAADTLDVSVQPRGTRRGAFEVVARGSQTARFTSDLWVHGGVAYTGTWGFRGPSPNALPGDQLYVWDVTDPSRPVLTDSVKAEGAAVVNDVKVRRDGRLAVATVEFSTNNGVLLLDLADPRHPAVITRFTPRELASASGVHNTWIDGDHVYAVTHQLVTLDVSVPSAPRVLSTYFGGSSFLHDVVVRDGLAFLSHWDVGLVILDVGQGMAGGTPANPMEVGRIALPDYPVHNAWPWPESGYVFLGDEVGIPGVMRVIDVRDPRRPFAVASFTVPGAAPHNFWLDEERGILYMAWYENGVIALDVSGELRGELELQGREIARLRYAEGGRCPFNGDPVAETCAFAPQLEEGFLYVADMNTGLWVLRPGF